MQATGPRLPIYLKAPPARLIELSENLFPERTVSITILPLEQITFLKEQGLNDFLHSQELEKLNTLTHAKRNREWLGGIYPQAKQLAELIHYYRTGSGPYWVEMDGLAFGGWLPEARRRRLEPGRCDGFHPEYTEAFDLAEANAKRLMPPFEDIVETPLPVEEEKSSRPAETPPGGPESD